MFSVIVFTKICINFVIITLKKWQHGDKTLKKGFIYTVFFVLFHLDDQITGRLNENVLSKRVVINYVIYCKDR